MRTARLRLRQLSMRQWRSALCVTLVTLSSTACHQRPTVQPGYHEYAYVTNGKSNSVSVLDLLQLRNVKTIPVGGRSNRRRRQFYPQ